MKPLTHYLSTMVQQDGSDLFFSPEAPVSCKIFGKMQSIDSDLLSPEAIRNYAYDIMSPEQITQFEHKPEMNLAISEAGIGRFRVNIFRQRSHVAMVIRAIKTEIPSIESLNLPPILTDLIMIKRGLVLFVGGTGSGKSTSLASLINFRNTNSAGHIITIEDPIEFVHPHKKSIVNQREVGVDTDSYEDALENTLRQAPDVILIGEIRTAETMEHALAFAETGHLCISTLHANNANQAIDRIVNFFPEERHKQLFMDLSLNLKGIVSQRLIPTIDAKRAAAVEILLGTPRVCELIKNGCADEIKEVMDKSQALGMQTFDTALYHLYKQGKISLEEALKNADSKNNLRLRVTLENGNGAEEKESAKDNTSATPTPKKPPAAPGSQFSLKPMDDEPE
ncbi:MAG: PilT/PilU family type 4a pilus ATPase [Pseudomonadota bacterium]